jgi:Ni/Fe-hydrogenase subunit HybB-like protein
MVIFEGTLSHKFLHGKMDATYLHEHDDVTYGFAKGASVVLIGYLGLKIVGVALGNNWHYLLTGYGAWFLVEILGFVALPAFLYAIAVRERNLVLIRWTSLLTVLGIVLNRFNVSLVAFNWQLAPTDRYFPSWMEIAISLFIVTIGVLVFRFAATYMPIFYEHPEYKEHEPVELVEHELKAHPQGWGH